MNTKLKLSIIACLSIIFITGCKPKAATRPEGENQISFDTLRVNETYHLLGDSTYPCCSLESVFIFPSGFNDKAILDKITRHFMETCFGEETASMTPQEAIDAYAEKYIADYKEFELDFITEIDTTADAESMPLAGYTCYEMSSNEIVYNQHNLLSYTVSVEYYTGGAHGGHGISNYVLFLENGEELDEDDIFMEGYQDELAQILVEAIALDNNVTNPKELENMGYFNIDEIYPNNNFYVNGEGLAYTFNEYEIAAYFVGNIVVFLPYEKIQHLLRDDTPIASLASIKNEPYDNYRKVLPRADRYAKTTIRRLR